MLQDSKGFIWIGTANGLNRFDGYSFRIFKRVPGDSTSLPGNNISRLAEDKQGRIWISYDGDGIAYYDPVSEKFSTCRLEYNGAAIRENISMIYFDSEGEMWLTARGYGMLHFDNNTKKVKKVYKIPDISDTLQEPHRSYLGIVTALYEDEQKKTWLASYNGLYLFDKKTGEIKPVESKKTTFNFKEADLNSLYADDNNGLWMGSNKEGLVYYNRLSGEWKNFKYSPGKREMDKNRISGILRKSNTELWVATSDTGLIVFNTLTHQFSFEERNYFRKEIPQKRCFAILKDKANTIWAAHQKGLTNINTGKELFTYHKVPVTRTDYRDLYTVSGIIAKTAKNQRLLGLSFGDGLQVQDPATGKSKSIPYKITPGPDKTFVTMGLLRDSKNRIWLLIRNFLFRFDEEANRLIETTQPPLPGGQGKYNLFKELQEDGKGNIWITTMNNGVFCYSPEQNKYDHFVHGKDRNSICSNSIYKVEVDKLSRLWFGTYGEGISMYDPATGKFIHFTYDEKKKGSLLSNTVMSMQCDRNGYMWVGTKNGLCRINANQKEPGVFEGFGSSQGPVADVIFGMAMDTSGRIWANTRNELLYFDPVSLTYSVFGGLHGLRSDDYKAFHLFPQPDGKLLIGSFGGYYEASARDFQAVSPEFNLVITDFRVEDRYRVIAKEMDRQGKINLSAKENFISFDFAALGLPVSSGISYAYKLEGFNKEWVCNSTRHYAGYTNLPPGDYVFKVRATTGSFATCDAWQGGELAIPVHISTPFFQTWWFISLCGLLVTGCFYFIFRGRSRKLREQKEELEAEQAINYFASSMYEQQSVETILWDVAKNCIGQLQFEDCVIYLVDEERKVLVQRAANGTKNPGSFQIQQPIDIPIGKGITGSVAQTGKAEIIDDTSKDPRYIIDIKRRSSEITVPIISNGRVLGVIDCEHSKKRFFTQKHLSILTTIASLCAGKIIKARTEAQKLEAERILMDTQKKMADVEMQALRAQMNPHFIFNCLNSINRYIVKSDQVTASLYLTRFAKLIRLILDNSNSKAVTLTNELEALRLYIEMESIRFEKQFTYSITVDEGVQPEIVYVPPLIIQPYVENAIWHGLLHKETAGHLDIHISRRSRALLQCVIQDNGVGREKAKELKSKSAPSKKSLGMKLTEDRLALLNKQAELDDASVEIEDLKTKSGLAAGTKVILKIPVDA